MNNASDLVSVIVPVYNVEKYLDKCIKSIVNQTYRHLEIILVDDGSVDLSGQICDDWMNKDERIQVIHKENGGLSDARNAGIDVAQGKYYAFVDSDDFLALDTIESMYQEIKTSDSEIAVCNMVRINEENVTTPFYCPVCEKKILCQNERYLTLQQPSVCNKLFDSKLFQEIYFPKGKYYEDTFIYHELLYRAKNVVLTGKEGYFYLVREGSIIDGHQYMNRYFDFIEAVWNRAMFLTEHNVEPYGKEACLSLYAALSNAERNITKNAENRELFEKAHKQYKFVYNILKKYRTEISTKQRIRLILLRYFPKVHLKIY